MVKIFVAEDQPLFLQDITTRIMSIRPDLQLCGTAANGEEALNKILAEAPDIVFTDIKMPRLSGLELMERVKAALPRTKFVVISGYQDYEYMHKALQLNADEYLLKPVAPADIAHVVNSICSKLLLGQKDFERVTICEILFSSARNPIATNLSISCGTYHVYVLNAGPCATYGIDFLNPFAVLWDQLDPEALAQGLLGPGELAYCYDGKAVNEKVLFCGLNSPPDKFHQKLCHALLSGAGEHQIPLTVGISRDVHHLSNIGVEGQVVRTLLRKNLVFGASSVLFCNDTALFNGPRHDVLSAAQEKQLQHSAESRRPKAFKEEIAVLLQEAQSRNYTQVEVQQLLNAILRSCIADANLASGEDFQLSLEEALCNAGDYVQLESSIMPIYELCAAHSTGQQGDVSSERLQNARSYIASHFQDAITINEIADRFHIAPSYFSRVFKKEFGITAIEYLSACRIEHAKLLLPCERYSIREVAELCGYSDPFYFSRIFKGVTGASPSEFQQNANKQEP